MYTYEKEIVMYAYYKNLVYFSTECIYSPNAYRGHVRGYLKDIERVRPTCILDIIHSGTQEIYIFYSILEKTKLLISQFDC